MKTIRNCCGCTLLLILLLIAALFALAWAIFSARPAHAQTDSAACAAANLSTPAQTITITPAIPLSPPATTTRGVFFTKQLSVTLRGGECVILALTPIGSGAPWVDDAMNLQVTHADGITAEWSHDFRNTDHTQIIPSLPQDLSALFGRGENQVTVSLQDLSPNVFGSSPLWLVIFAPPTNSAPTAAPTTSMPSATPAAQTSPTPTPVLPIGIPAANSSPSLLAGLPRSSDQTSPTAATIAAAGLLAIVVTAVAVRRARRLSSHEGPVYSGTLLLSDEKTFETLTVELADWIESFAIFADPLRVEPLQRGRAPTARVTPCAEGIRLQTDQQETADALILRHGDSTNIGSLKLTLENLPIHPED